MKLIFFISTQEDPWVAMLHLVNPIIKKKKKKGRQHSLPEAERFCGVPVVEIRVQIMRLISTRGRLTKRLSAVGPPHLLQLRHLGCQSGHSKGVEAGG